MFSIQAAAWIPHNFVKYCVFKCPSYINKSNIIWIPNRNLNGLTNHVTFTIWILGNKLSSFEVFKCSSYINKSKTIEMLTYVHKWASSNQKALNNHSQPMAIKNKRAKITNFCFHISVKAFFFGNISQLFVLLCCHLFFLQSWNLLTQTCKIILLLMFSLFE